MSLAPHPPHSPHSSHSSLHTSPTAPPAPGWRWPLAYVTTAVVFLGMDAVWLSHASQALYQPAIGHLMATSVDWVAAALFYPLYIAGVVFFGEAPALLQGRSRVALWRGALFGLIAYGTYDLTNQATLKDWPWSVTMMDLVWGSFASGVAAWAGTALTLATCQRANRTSGR
ncbi:DUF2177 family protein [Roseateles sp. SL47]|uniref:DUF2177 family protein n=1 Tax=Roseateles sp. SL47 TaxID=2995138 RepID=UPI002271BF18|nr:DUF2177 family protein [Roseateles sp. SL47]WAC71735.1 DUF2177 family protein [Roseateles sp. SL47]